MQPQAATAITPELCAREVMETVPLVMRFADYLGEMQSYLDMLLDCRDGCEGGSEVLGGVHSMPCNWKFAAENCLGDAYHNSSQRSVDLVDPGYLTLWGREGPMSHQVAMRAIDLLGQEVIPALKDYQADREKGRASRSGKGQ